MDSRQSRIESIRTRWSAIKQSGAEDDYESAKAHIALFHRYERSVYKYLLGAVKDSNVADELFQEFSIKLVTGRYATADPSRGRFRDYLRRSLQNLVTDWYRKSKRDTELLDTDVAGTLPEDFDTSYRQGILESTMRELQKVEVETGRPLATVLRLRIESPQMRSAELAEQLTRVTESSREITAPSYRKLLERARSKFSELLIFEVSKTLSDPSPEAIEAELGELKLLAYLSD